MPTMIDAVTVVRCASPSCRKRVMLPTGTRRQMAEALYALGWRAEQQPGDDRQRTYCERCHT